MWRFNPAEERRYDSLLGLRPKPPRTTNTGSPARCGAARRRYLLSAAARLCRWRDGRDTRRHRLAPHDGARVERAMIRTLAEITERVKLPERKSTPA